jgi:hypothetical protein
MGTTRSLTCHASADRRQSGRTARDSCRYAAKSTPWMYGLLGLRPSACMVDYVAPDNSEKEVESRVKDNDVRIHPGGDLALVEAK